MALAAAAFVCCFSCTDNNKQNPDVPEPPKEDDSGTTTPQEEDPNKQDPQDEDTLKPGTFKFVASAFQGNWKEGDKIYVHGNYGPYAEVVTLSSADISEDGKTASANLDKVTTLPCAPDGLYAAWPADSVVPNDGMMDSFTTFNSDETLFTVAYLDGDTFTFVDASAFLTFTVDGDFNQYAISSAIKDGLRATSFQADYTSAKALSCSLKSDGYPYRYGTLASGEETSIIFQGGVSLSRGYTIHFGKDGKWTACYKVDNSTKIKPGTVTALGNITSSLEAYSGPAPKMPEMKSSKSYPVKLNELSGLCLSVDGDFLWAVGDGGELARIDLEGNVISKRSIGGDTEGLTIEPETGDLLIAMEPASVGRITAAEGYEGKMTTIFKIKEASGKGNAGMEGISYYKDGLVFCGTQLYAELFLCDLNAEVDSNKYTPIIWSKQLVSIIPGIDEVGGMCYDPLTDWLWITDSNMKKLFVLTSDAETLLGTYPVKKVVNAESIFVDHIHSCVWVGCDTDSSTSQLYKFDFTGLDDAIIAE